MKKIKPDYIFLCKKCGHNLYITKDKIIKLLKTDCPECGEESYENWIFIGEGDFGKKYPHLVTVKN